MKLEDIADDGLEVLTVEEAAKVLRIGRNAAYASVRLWRKTNGREGLPVIVLGRTLRVPVAVLREMLKQPSPTPEQHAPTIDGRPLRRMGPPAADSPHPLWNRRLRSAEAAPPSVRRRQTRPRRCPASPHYFVRRGRPQMPKRNASATPRRDPKTGTWWFTVDLGPGPNGKGEWKDRRQAVRRGYATKQGAQEALSDLRSSASDGTYVPPASQSLGEFLRDDWLPAVSVRLAASTFESYERNIRHHVVAHIGARNLQAVDGATLNRLYALLLNSGRKRGNQSPGLKPRTVRYVHTILHSALGDAMKWRRISVNPADQATPPSAKSARAPEMKTWTATELATFLARTTGDRYGFAWSFLATTACRRGEALGLRWTDVDLKAGLASIRQQVVPVRKPNGTGRQGLIVPGTKTGHARVIELDSRTVLELRRWKKVQAKERLAYGKDYEDHGLVFPRWDGRPFHPEFFSKTFDRRLRQKAFEDLPTIRLHDLRHTWATLALEAGVDVAIVSKQLGHSSPTVTWNTYQHVRKDMKANAVKKVADLIFGEDTEIPVAAGS